MPKLLVFNHITLDGYFTGPKGDLSWAHTRQADPEWKAFVSENASGGGTLLFGRITYEMMSSYWPTPMAAQNDPVVAKQMNALPKFVASRTLDKPSWTNTTLLKGDLEAEVRKLKSMATQDIVVMGSGKLVAQLAQAGLIDEYQFVVVPVALGSGRTMFECATKTLNMTRTNTRTFGNGNVLLQYRPTT
jgi:dihydrofolate reductase